MPFQDIKTKRLVIREYSDMYLEQVFEFRSDPSIYSSYTKKQNTKDELKAYLKENITEFNKQDGYSVFLILLEEKVDRLNRPNVVPSLMRFVEWF